MELNAALFVAVGFVLFVVLLAYLGVHKTITSALDGRIASIANELEEARRMRAEAKAASVPAWPPPTTITSNSSG